MEGNSGKHLVEILNNIFVELETLSHCIFSKKWPRKLFAFWLSGRKGRRNWEKDQERRKLLSRQELSVSDLDFPVLNLANCIYP